MQKLRQILLLLSNGASQQRICKEVHCSKRTVSNYRKVAQETQRSYDELLALSDNELSSVFKPSNEPVSDGRKEELERLMPEIIKRLERKHATVQFVYEDFYIKQCPTGYRYTQFKEYVRSYRKKNDVSYHNDYEPGEEWQIDFAGDALYIVDPVTKENQKLVVLVCVMPYSQLIFMHAMPNATTDWFFHGLNQGLIYMDALPRIAKSDNMKQWVNKSDRYSLSFSDASLEWALYYGIEPTACRVRKPRDKGPAEGAVNQLYRYVYARLEGETHYSLDDINARIRELLDEYNSKPYKGSTRKAIFEQYEKPQMHPLPNQMYRSRMRKDVKLSGSYHVCVGSERHFYSVPYTYVGQTVKVMWDIETVEVYVKNTLVCMHQRSFVPYGYTTEKMHMPEAHTAYEQRKEVNAAKLIEWGAKIGPSVEWAITDILQRTTFPQQAYGRCSALLGLAKKYGRNRLNHASHLMQEQMGTASYKALETILKNNRDLEQAKGVSVTPFNEDVRGANAYTSIRKEGRHG